MLIAGQKHYGAVISPKGIQMKNYRVAIVDFSGYMAPALYTFTNSHLKHCKVNIWHHPVELIELIDYCRKSRNRPHAVIFYFSDEAKNFAKEKNFILSFSTACPSIRGVVFTSIDSFVARKMSERTFYSVISKREPLTTVNEMLQSSIQGQTALSPRLEQQLNADPHQDALARKISSLSRREHTVIRELLTGISLSKIAYKHAINVKTAASYKYSAFRKLGIEGNSTLAKMKLEWF